MALTGEQALSLAKKYTKETAEGMGAIKGEDGFSPIIVENPNNTDKDYRLDITDANKTFTTPNLNGTGGDENVQSDWNETDAESDAFIKNKPSIPSIEGLATTEYVDDSVNKLTDDVTGENYKMGIEKGLIYVQEI